MVTFIQAVILSLIQGITEWFPISSSGHLAVAQELMGIEGIGFAVYLHFASVISIFILYRKEIIRLLRPNKENYRYIIKLLLAVIPAAIIGFFYLDHVRYAFGNMTFMGIFFILMGIFIYSTKFAHEIKNKISISDSIFIGVSQIFSLFPGISRSGMTMGTGFILGLKKEQAITFSFLLAIPMVLGASIVEAQEIISLDIHFTALLTSFMITLLTSLLSIKYLVKIVKDDKFFLFGVYNIIFGVFILVWSLI